MSFFDEIGGTPTIERIVRGFYVGVAEDEVLRPMYPADDLEPSIDHLTKFLAQYWGGPKAYQEERGHPRLRMRHADFRVDEDARDRWLAHFRVGLDEAGLTPEQDKQFWDYVTHAATFLINA
jgi:hemoglobin